MWRRKEKDTDKLEEERLKKQAKRVKKKRRTVARRLRLLHFILVAYYKYKYSKKYKHEIPDYHELVEELDKPYKVAGYIFGCVNSIQDKDIDPFKKLIHGEEVTDKTVILFINTVLRYHGYSMYTFWVGFRASKLLPLSIISMRDVSISMGPESYKIHIGDQFDIMRDYYPNGNRWIVLTPTMSDYIMSYSKGRSEIGSPDVCLYDTKYWGKRRPLAEEIMSNLKIKPLSQRDEGVI